MRVAILALLAGCTPTLESDFGDDLTDRGGCADVVFYAVNAADTTMLTVIGDGLVDAATTAGQTTTTTYELPDSDVILVVEVGSRVSDATCDDVIENGGPVVNQTWTATEGTVTIEIVPGASAYEATGTATLQDVTFEVGGERRDLDSFEIADVSVGWLPG